MSKTYGPYLTDWPVPVDFHEVLSFKAFKDCFKFRITDTSGSKKTAKTDKQYK